MTYELKIERLFDAPPEVVFDTLVDPDAQEELFNDQVEGWKLWEFEIDLRVGGTWTIVFGPAFATSGARTIQAAALRKSSTWPTE